MTKLVFENPNCFKASLENGHEYRADRRQQITVEDSRDVKALQAGGYSLVGGMPKLHKYWVCDECNWDAAINSCRYCGSTNLRRVEK